MTSPEETVLEAWRINDRVTTFLVENIPAAIWASGLPASPRRTVRGVAAHLHNSRCSWMRSLAVGAAVPDPESSRPPRRHPQSPGDGSRLQRQGHPPACSRRAKTPAGCFPAFRARSSGVPCRATSFSSRRYAVSHEAHHRGQLLLMARELGHRLPPKVAAGLWQWSSRLKESRSKRASGA